MSSTVATRSEVPESDKWDLSHLFTDVSKWQEDFAWLQSTYPKFQKWKGKVGESAQMLAAVLAFEKSLEQKMERVYHYASLQLAEDSTNNEYLARVGQLQNLLTKIGEAAAFVVPEIMAINDEKFARFIADPVLKDWRIKLYKIRRMKPHVLSEPEERLLALGSVALSGYNDTFSQLTDVDMKFGALKDETGRERPLTQSSFSSFLVKRDPELRKRTFDDAVEMVLAALAPLGKEYVDALAEGLRSKRWCDRYESKGKRSGAFSSGSYGAPPYILMNYKEDIFADVYTLAHETGHSMHSWFSQNSQLFQDYEYPIFLAEVASTFNEELLTHHLLQTTTDPKMRAYIINRQIDDLRGTLFRQTMFAEFEKIIHAVEESGDALTLAVFKSEYHKLLETYFAENVALDPQLDLECLRIPHFYHAFYVYKYATGISAAVALSERVLSGQPGSVDAYLNFLRSGGSQFPLETLKAAGVDMATPAPIESTLRLFERRLKELEELLL